MKKELRIIFIGTPDFAVESLNSIIESGRNIVAVITAPDRKAGRGRQLRSSAVKEYALKKQLPILQPTNLKSEVFLEELKAYRADIQIVVAFRMMPEAVWNMPPLGTFNLHASLLPNYRGAAPINWAIINGEKQTGVSTFFLKHQIDTGDLLIQKEVKIGMKETAGSLHDKLMKVGGDLVVKTLEKIENDSYQAISQNSLINNTDKIKEAPKIFKENCRIDWSKPVIEVDQLVRGLSPYPTAWTQLQHLETNKTIGLKVYETDILSKDQLGEIGTLSVNNKCIHVQCKKGVVQLNEIQLEGKKRMTAKELLNGFDLSNFKMN